MNRKRRLTRMGMGGREYPGMGKIYGTVTFRTGGAPVVNNPISISTSNGMFWADKAYTDAEGHYSFYKDFGFSGWVSASGGLDTGEPTHVVVENLDDDVAYNFIMDDVE